MPATTAILWMDVQIPPLRAQKHTRACTRHRLPRSDFHFVDKHALLDGVKAGEFLEHARIMNARGDAFW